MPDAKRLRGDPSKEFFISMLVKDIQLDDAILDLVDNSVDGARRQEPDNGASNLSKYHIKIKFDDTSFTIDDNCGGIPLDVAKEYAFRFGRDPDRRPEGRSIGLFGVGMKRALFKLGEGFQVRSRTLVDGFKTTVSVPEWQQTDDDWSFPYQSQKPAKPGNAGTRIRISPLHQATAARFAERRFSDALAGQVGSLHRETMSRGLTVHINGREVPAEGARLLVGDRFAPMHQKWTEGSGKSRIRVVLYAGIERDPPGAGGKDAGWYVYLNGRLVLSAERTDRTGWGIGSVPRYHPQYASFRGHVFLDAEKSWLLPWTTTKSGLDLDSDLYRRVRERMMTATREVIALFNQRKAESEVEKRPLREAIDVASSTALSTLPISKTVKYPVGPNQPRFRNILYKKPAKLADQVRDELDAASLSDAGSRTFDYWVEHELNE